MSALTYSPGISHIKCLHYYGRQEVELFSAWHAKQSLAISPDTVDPVLIPPSYLLII